jgi:hypothetical protein
MLRRTVCLAAHAVLPALTALPASAQIFMSEPSRGSRGSWSFDVGGQMAQPVHEFRTNVNQAWGFGATVRYNLPRFEALGLRSDFSYLNYGNESKRVPLSSTVNRVTVDMRTSNNILVASLGPELAVRSGPIRPYVYGFAGFSYFFTESSADDDEYGGSFARSTNFDDGGLATGGGGGIRIPLRFRSVDASIDGGARFTQNGLRNYLVRGDIVDQADGSLVFNTRTTRADFWQYHLGMSFSPRRRR